MHLPPEKIRKLAVAHYSVVRGVLDSNIETLIEAGNEFIISCDNKETYILAFALAKASFDHAELYDELWTICKNLEKDGKKRAKRGKLPVAENYTELTPRQLFLSVLSYNLFTTKILTLSITEAEKCDNVTRDVTISDPTAYENDSMCEDKQDFELCGTVHALLQIVIMFSYGYAMEFLDHAKRVHDYQVIDIEMARLTKDAKALNKKLVSQASTIDRLTESNRKLREKPVKPPADVVVAKTLAIRDELAEKDAVIANMSEECSEYKQLLSIQDDEILDLKKKLVYYNKVSDVLDSPHTDEGPVCCESDSEDFDERLRSMLTGYRVVIYGGHVNWRLMIKTYCDNLGINVELMDSFSVRQNVNDIVVYNMCHMSHPDYDRYCNLQKHSPVKTNLYFLRGTAKFKYLLYDLLTKEI